MFKPRLHLLLVKLLSRQSNPAFGAMLIVIGFHHHSHLDVSAFDIASQTNAPADPNGDAFTDSN